MMRRTLVFAAAVTALLAAASDFPRAQAPRPLALVGGMLLTGYDVPPVHHAAILIEGTTIVQAGPASEVTIPRDAVLVDTTGTTRPGFRGSRLTAARRCSRGSWKSPPGSC
jgi:hypothetical protein